MTVYLQKLLIKKDPILAQYKHGQYLTQSHHEAFDTLLSPGISASNAGIYRCAACGDEIGIAKGHTLPPQNHHQHSPGQGPIKWQLSVFAVQR
jgi:hypothetical protein